MFLLNKQPQIVRELREYFFFNSRSFADLIPLLLRYDCGKNQSERPLAFLAARGGFVLEAKIHRVAAPGVGETAGYRTMRACLRENAELRYKTTGNGNVCQKMVINRTKCGGGG
jgi:hypothetical protein